MFNFNFGNKKRSIKQYAIIGIVLSSIIASLSHCTGISQNNIWDLLDEVQRKYFPLTIINDFIIKDPEKLDRRVNRDVTRAIDLVMPEYDLIIMKADQRFNPKYVNEVNDDTTCYSDDCRALAPPMRICAPWVDTCPKE